MRSPFSSEDKISQVRLIPNAWVDGFGHYFFSLPAKLVLLDWKVDDHDVSPEVEASIEEYLRVNGLCNTKVRINQYAPGGEWRRLFKNREMPGGWRYSLGLLSVTFYTIFPDRLFAGFPFIGGGDSYNPYTNTIHIYSDRRPIALHEGGHAKDFAEIENRHWKGVYAGARAIPLAGLLVALWQEGDATQDALSWELATAGSAVSKRAYRSLYPAYGTYLGGTAQSGASLFTGGWVLYVVQYGVVVAGHVVGQTRALFVRDRDEGLQPALVEDGVPPPGAVLARPCEPASDAGDADGEGDGADAVPAAEPDASRPDAEPAEPDASRPVPTPLGVDVAQGLEGAQRLRVARFPHR
jgi:hypothetical protein